ncbi:zinc finger CCCH domain-containing protein 7B-like [Boleophthalmus pectinirostris]|uniref:zinc finger CCCH domain-containing protein 7B-like n=1 Tax=Boleophthalmus pectinirostris TaxID=150288 RepID=UPI000A1C27D4|nr:zinc finger CCCH domain-containing protein 7B-like [Boleophthalmus pectinirostris]XP_020782909.1 zinc finger CCCH domain-containing protein 7B-like [Boleophthalmus pectinirostris]
MDPGRLKRKGEINKALQFIQSSLAYPDPQGYQDFLTGLVCNLLEEGNALFKDRAWEEAVKEFSEGLNVAQYASSEDICIPEVLLESLYVNRAAAYYSMGEYGRGVEDCDKALLVCKESRRALFRKALCLKELKKYKEAYSCTTDCLLISHMDNQVNELAQELAIQLGLKIRKPFVSVKMCTNYTGNGSCPLPTITQENFSSQDPTLLTAQGASQMAVSSVPEMLDDSDVMGDDLDSLLDTLPNEPTPTETHLQAFSIPGVETPSKHAVPPVLPAPTPQLPPAFFSSAGSQLNCLDSFAASGSMVSTLDALDDVSTSHNLDQPHLILYGTAASNAVLTTTQNSLNDLDSLDDLLPSETTTAEEASISNNEIQKYIKEALDMPHKHAATGFSGEKGLNALDSLDSLDALDALDTFSSTENMAAEVGAGLDALSDFQLNDECSLRPAPLKTSIKERNKHSPARGPKPLTLTHEFMLACSTCYPRTGRGIYTFVHKPDLVHSCEKDILLCREKDSILPWTRVRPMPAWTSFTGPFVLCKELLKSGELGLCKYGENCTFAFNQTEIDVWTEERKGRFNRNLLSQKPAMKQEPVSGIIQILQENKGMFIFLCGACFDCKPTIISKRSRDDDTVCSNTSVRHLFDANKCLAFMMRNITVRYRKVRPLHLNCHLDLCRHCIRYGCLLGDECMFAHSDVELKTWKLQRETGTKPEEIVKVSTDYYEKLNKNTSNQQSNKSLGPGKPKGGRPKDSLNMRMRFVCGHCWRDGVTSDPDKSLKYCSAKAKHMWTKDKRILLVKSLERDRSKWVMVRTLPHCKHFPLHYDICHRILDRGKCNVGNCTFAHSQEEKDMWTYMKNNKLVDMQQVYDMWLNLSTLNHQNEEPVVTQPSSEEKCIVMPTDCAEPMDGFHCRLCGRHSNSEKQWQKHISSEKHKDRVFSCDEEEKALTWNYRFPAKCFNLCPRLDDNCPDGMSCDYAHSPDELQEWIERRDFLRRKLARAREDMLIMPDESDFGKYNFLLHD